MSRSLDQQRAAYAWSCVEANCSRDYANLAKGAPALVMSNGLMQTLAFYQSKGAEHQRLARHLCGWLEQRGLARSAAFRDVMKGLHGEGSAHYLRATEETLEILRWIRQFAAAVQKG
jgi:CRISPR-associated protein Cmr5